MRTIFVYLALLTSFLGFSQTNPNLIELIQPHENHISCGWGKKVFDICNAHTLKSTNIYPLSSQITCGKFKVFYADLLPGAPAVGFADPVHGTDRINTFCAVLTYIQSVFDFSNVPSNNPIRIEVEASLAPIVNPAGLTVRYAAFAGPTFNTSISGKIEGGNMFNYITEGNNNVDIDDFHGIMKVNFDGTFNQYGIYSPINWLNNHSQNISNCKIDLYSVLLHELGHMLGFLSLTNNDGQLAPQSLSGNNNFSVLDFLLHRSDNLSVNSLQKFILGTSTVSYLNPIFSNVLISDSKFWVNGNPAPNNHPIFSGELSSTTTDNQGSFLSHLDEQILSYTKRSRNSPGYAEDYVMGPFTKSGLERRVFCDAEIKVFLEMGYSLNATYSNSNLNNLPPYSIKIGTDPNYIPVTSTSPNQSFYVEIVNADATINNNVNTSITFNLWEDSGIMDPEGQELTVADGTLTNIRGCGNGGNNHDQLTISVDKKSITFTPRANFIGRAQFAFKLYDGAKVGSWHLYTIDVLTGTNVNYPLGSNLLINGDLEEGTEVRRSGFESNKAYTSVEYNIKEGFLSGYHYSDANPHNFISNLWVPYGGGDYIKNTLSFCNPFTFGRSSNNFPGPNNNPIPLNNIGDRYRSVSRSYNYFGLGSNLQKCHKYILKFDYFLKSDYFTGNNGPIPITFGFTNSPTYPSLPTLENLFTENIDEIPLNTWIHKEITFNYCSTIPTNFLNILCDYPVLVDNIELIEIVDFPQISANLSGINNICIGGTSNITANVNDEFCNVTYLWSNGETTSSINVSPISTQTYTVTVNDECQTATASSTITVNPEITPTFTQLPNYCVGQTPANLPTTSNNNIIGEWSPQVISTSTSGSTTYTFTPTSNPCASTVTMIITVNPLPSATITASSSTTFCQGGSVILTTPLDATYTYQWQQNGTNISGATSNSYIATTSGSYTVVVTSNNCSATSNAVIVTVNQTITPTFTQLPNYCVGQTPASLPNPSNNSIIGSWDPQVISTSSPGTTTYTFTPTSNPCASTATMTITVNPTITPTFTQLPNYCLGQTPTNLPNPSNNSILGSWDPQVISTSTSGTTTYTFTPTSNPCASTATMTITVNPTPTVNNISSQTVCSGQQTTPVTFSGTATNYPWTNSNTGIGLGSIGTGNIDAFTATNSSSLPITSTISVTPTSGTCSGTPVNFTITVNPLPTVPNISVTETSGLSPNDGIVCSGSGVTLNASGSLYPVWSTGTSSYLIFVSPTSTTTYTATVTNSNGCSSIASQVITVSPSPSVNPISNQNLCVNTNSNIINFTGTSDATFTWTNSNPSIGLNPSSGQSIPSFVALNNNPFPISGIITVTPTLNGCAGSSTSFTVTVNPYPTLSISPNPVSITAGISTPLTVTSSPSGATYVWSNGSTNSTVTVSPTSTTTYTVTGTLNGCSSSASVQVIVEPIVACANCTNNNISGDAAGNISLNPAPNLSYCINNNLNITGNVTFRTSEFKIASNVTITVQPNATLTILGCHLYSCGNMWNGIVVKPGGRLVVDDGLYLGSSGWTIISHRFNSFIEDAKTAIQIQDNSPITSGYILTVKNAVFNRNQYGIRIGTYTQNLATYPFSVENCIFTCRRIDFGAFNAANPNAWPRNGTIRGTAPLVNTSLSNVYINNGTYSQTHANAFLKAPFPNQKPLAGIELTNVGLTINAISPTPVYREFKMGNSLDMTIFDNLRIGVSLKNSNFTTVNSVFQNTNGSKGIGIYATAESAKNNRLQVLPVLTTAGNNKFVDCGRAISSSNYYEVNIQYSDIRSSQVDNIPSTEMQGIQLASNRYKNYRILFNTLYNVQTAIAMTATNGDYNISGVPTFGQYVGKVSVDFNTIRPHLASVTSLSGQSVENGIILQNIGQLTEYADVNNQTIISTNGNSLEACRGIYYNNWYKVNSQIQNNSISVNYNQYVNPIFYGISISNCLPQNNSFIRSNTITGFYTPSTNNNPLSDPNLTGIVTSLSPGFSVTCNSTNKTVRGIGFNGGNSGTIFKNNTMQNHRYGFFLDNNGVIEQQGTLTAPADNRWNGTWLPGNFKTAILGNSSAQNSKMYIRTASAYNPDGSGESFTPVPQFTRYSLTNGSLIESPNASFPILPCLQSLLASDKKIALEKVALDQIIYSEDVNNLGEKMRYINKLLLYNNLKADSTLRDSSMVLNDFYTDYLSSTYETIHWVNKHLEKGDLLNAVLSNEAFVPNNNIEENFKKYHEIYIKYYQQSLLNQQDSTNLKELAEKCPFSDGSVIYKARALYNLIFAKNDVFSDDCISSNFSKSMNLVSELETSNELILYPNPAKDEVYIQLNNNEATKLEIQVFDAMGKIVLNQTDLLVRNGLTTFTLNVINGIYFVNITNLSTHETTVKKLVVRK